MGSQSNNDDFWQADAVSHQPLLATQISPRWISGPIPGSAQSKNGFDHTAFGCFKHQLLPFLEGLNHVYVCIYIIYPSPIFIHRPWRQAVFRLWDLAVSGSISGAELQFVLTQAPTVPGTVPGKPWNRKIHGESLWKNHGHRRKKDIFSKILRLSWYSWYRKSTLSWIQRQNRIGDGSKE